MQHSHSVIGSMFSEGVGRVEQCQMGTAVLCPACTLKWERVSEPNWRAWQKFWYLWVPDSFPWLCREGAGRIDALASFSSHPSISFPASSLVKPNWKPRSVEFIDMVCAVSLLEQRAGEERWSCLWRCKGSHHIPYDTSVMITTKKGLQKEYSVNGGI